MDSNIDLFFDTETTGRADFKRPPGDPAQPRLVSLACVALEGGREVASFKAAVRNDGFASQPEALEKHGIEDAWAAEFGVPRLTLLSFFYHLHASAARVWAFNYQFDALVLGGEYVRAGKPCPFAQHPEKGNCEMLACKDVLKLPGRYGDYKWPSLAEAHRAATGGDIVRAHDAMADVRAMLAVHKWRTALPPGWQPPDAAH